MDEGPTSWPNKGGPDGIKKSKEKVKVKRDAKVVSMIEVKGEGEERCQDNK
jgi:hypothetical protein